MNVANEAHMGNTEANALSYIYFKILLEDTLELTLLFHLSYKNIWHCAISKRSRCLIQFIATVSEIKEREKKEEMKEY